MNRRGLQPLGVVVPSFRLLKSFHLLITLRKKFTERIIHYPEYLPSPDRRHLACLRPRLPPSPPPPRAAAPPARSAQPWHLGGKCAVFAHAAPLLRPMRTIGDPTKGPFFNGFVGPVPTVGICVCQSMKTVGRKIVTFAHCTPLLRHISLAVYGTDLRNGCQDNPPRN